MAIIPKIRSYVSAWRGAAGVIGALVICAIGARMVAPGINPQVIGDFFRTGGSSPLLRAYDWFVGGAVSRGALLAIGMMPYVSARIYVWLSELTIPRIAEIASHPDGPARISRWTLGLTFGFALLQSYGFARFVQSLPGAVTHPGTSFIAQTMLVLTASAMCVTWLSERLRDTDDSDSRSHSDRSDARARIVIDKTALIAGSEVVAEGGQQKDPVAVGRSAG